MAKPTRKTTKDNKDNKDKIPTAQKIGVKDLALLYQWPLMMELPSGTHPTTAEINREFGKTLEAFTKQAGNTWTVADPATFLSAGADDCIPHDYQEYVYFHDFTQKFLYPLKSEPGLEGAEAPTFYLFENKSRKVLSADIHTGESKQQFDFDIRRNTVHLFPLGVAVVTVELALAEGQKLNLAQAQNIIDYLRRSDVPYYSASGQHNKDQHNKEKTNPPDLAASVLANLVPEKVPSKVRVDGQEWSVLKAAYEHASKAMGSTGLDRQSRHTFPHWELFAGPLKKDMTNPIKWRDPSDERIPMNSYILLDEKTPPKGKDVLGISDGDWARLVEADDAGANDFAYNPKFARALAKKAYYDRFKPSGENTTGVGETRYLFGGAHFSSVGKGDMHAGMLREHWRRHYAQLSLIARFEMAALLAISSRLTDAVRLLEKGSKSSKDVANARDAFEQDVIEIQSQFLNFVHKFRFTGVSAQIQAQEMFKHWRRSLELDDLFNDIEKELASATQMVLALQQKRASDRGDRLNNLLFYAALIGVIVGVLGMNVLVGDGQALSDLFKSGWSRLFLIGGLASFGFGALSMASDRAERKRSKENFKPERRDIGMLVGGALVTFLAVLDAFLH